MELIIYVKENNKVLDGLRIINAADLAFMNDTYYEMVYSYFEKLSPKENNVIKFINFLSSNKDLIQNQK
jgi:hypothetical protein